MTTIPNSKFFSVMVTNVNQTITTFRALRFRILFRRARSESEITCRGFLCALRRFAGFGRSSSAVSNQFVQIKLGCIPATRQAIRSASNDFNPLVCQRIMTERGTSHRRAQSFFDGSFSRSGSMIGHFTTEANSSNGNRIRTDPLHPRRPA